VFTSANEIFRRIGTAEPPTGTKVLFKRAVVLGGSIAGLMAARVLSDHADEVVIIERDDTDGDEPRQGVPQGTQVHGLLPAGQIQLDRFFPGFFDESVAAGAVVPSPDAVRFFMNGAPRLAPGAGSDARSVVSSRPFLESLVRQRVRAIDNIRFVNARVEGLVFDGARVSGVRYTGNEPQTLDADFVVDTMGRSSRLSDWLESEGFARPPMRRMAIRINYATARFKRRLTGQDAIDVVVSHDTAAEGRTARIGGINAIENDHYMVLVSGYAEDKPSRDVEDFTRRCREDFPAVFRRVADACEMVGPVITYHQADSRRRDFHRINRFPARLVAAGDAIASFNPIYGQGMTSAMLHASCLSAYLRDDPNLDRPAKAYFALAKVVVDAAWQVSTFADLALPHVDGPYPRGYRMMDWISTRIFRVSENDAQVNHRLGLVTMMLAHPNSLMSAGVLWKALRTSNP
jgi:2-polyprenyl-6-methoxyphenol hydroxylase-like FAD-dependent oxidoreductase